MQWISVEDRLPETLESVIVWGKIAGDMNLNAHEAFVSMCSSGLAPGKRFHSVRDRTGVMAEVTHWMPMPDNPSPA